MSRIYRSRDATPTAHTINLLDTPMGPQNPQRPMGGIFGMAGLGSGETPISAFERRELDSQRLIEDAHRQAEVIQAEAYHAGFAEGERAGERLAQQKLEPVLQNLGGIIAELQQERARLITQHERELIKIGFSIGAAVVKHEVETNDATLADVVRAALKKVSHAQNVKLHLAPLDASILQRGLEAGVNIEFPKEHLEIVENDEIGRGGCRVETNNGDIDATIATQLLVLKSNLWSDE